MKGQATPALKGQAARALKGHATPAVKGAGGSYAAWFECVSGASGDMLIGALLAACDKKTRREFFKRMRPLERAGRCLISLRKVKRMGISALKFDVRDKKNPKTFPSMKDFGKALGAAPLSEEVKGKAFAVIRDIFRAEAKAHGAGRVHLHELSMPDTLIDAAGFFLCMELLGIEEAFFSPINLGGGSVKTAHGELPVPAPAVAELLKGAPVYTSEREKARFELTTPTGAAIIRNAASGFGPMPLLRLEKTGSGAGGRDLKEQPNILRVFIGKHLAPAPYVPAEEEAVTVIETNLDDLDPRIYEYVMGKLFAAGALDVFLIPIIMKKTRPGVVLSALCREADAPGISEIIFRETTTLGVRFFRAGRMTLERDVLSEPTPFGPVRFKTARLGSEIIKKSAEFRDCLRAAKKTGLPLKDIMEKLLRR